MEDHTTSGADWEFAQSLLDRGVCTLDQVREAIQLREHFRRTTGRDLLLEEILVERGYVKRAQLEARPSGRRYALIAAAGGFLLLAGLLIFVGVRPGGNGTPDPEDPERVLGTREVRVELERIAALGGDPVKAPEVVRRYEALIDRRRGRYGESEARLALRDFRAGCEEQARPMLEGIRAKEPELQREGRVVELLELYRGFPAHFLGICDAGREAGWRIAELTAMLEERYRSDRREVEDLAREGKLAEAAVRILEVERYATQKQKADLAALKTRVTAGLRDEISLRYYSEIDGPFKAAMSARDPRRAAGAVMGFLRHLSLPKVDPEALEEAVRTWEGETLVRLCEAAVPERKSPRDLEIPEAALLDLRNAALVGLLLRDARTVWTKALASGEILELPRLGRGRLLERSGKTFFDPGGPPVPVAFDLLAEEDVEALAGCAESVSEGVREVRTGFFYYYSGRKDLHARAYDALARAKRGGAKGVEVFLATLIVEVREELERLLAVKLGAAKGYTERRQWGPAVKLLDEVLGYEANPFVKENRERILRLRGIATAALEDDASLSKRYGGSVTRLEGGAMRVTYDFELPAQMDAFEHPEPHADRGRWEVTGGALRSSAGTSMLAWRQALRGDVLVEYDLMPLEKPQNIVLDLYYARGNDRHYAVVFGFDWVGRSEGDEKDTVEDTRGIPRMCVLKYPVSVEKARWKEPGPWATWKGALVGSASGVWVPRIGRVARVRVARVDETILVEVDGEKVWEGKDGDYDEGRLLFFSDSRCVIDNLTITLKEHGK